jgi:hypothetical protein
MPDSKPPVKLTEEQLAIAEETAARVEEITGRHHVTPEMQAEIDGRHEQTIDEKTKFSWPVLVLAVVAALSVGGLIWQTRANADGLKKVEEKADAAVVVSLEARVRAVEQAAASNDTAHKAIEKKLDQVDGKLDRLLEKK